MKMMVPQTLGGQNIIKWSGNGSLDIVLHRYCTPTNGNYMVSDIIGNAYVAGTQSITFTGIVTKMTQTAPTSSVSLSKSTTNATLPYTGTVTITATFSESMANSPTISVGGVSNAVMTSTSSSVWEYNWTINNGSWMTANTTTTTFATVSGTDIVGNAYSGTTSISFTIDNSPYNY